MYADTLETEETDIVSTFLSQKSELGIAAAYNTPCNFCILHVLNQSPQF